MPGKLFIVGMPRSGTTLFSMVFNAHPQIAIPPETDYFPQFRDPCENTNCLEHSSQRKEFLDSLFESSFISTAFTSNEQQKLRNKLRSSDVRDHKLILRTLLDEYAEKEGKPYWGEKTPVHMYYVDEIANMFPNVNFISVIRDPRDVCRSLENVPWRHDNLFTLARGWNHYRSLSRQLNEQFTDRFREVTYESLLTDTESTVKSLCEFLDIDFQPGMMSYHEDDSRTFDPEEEPWKQKNLRPIDSTNMEKWREEMAPYKSRLVEWITREELRQLPYPRDPRKIRFQNVPKLLGEVSSGVYRSLSNKLGRILS